MTDTKIRNSAMGWQTSEFNQQSSGCEGWALRPFGEQQVGH